MHQRASLCRALVHKPGVPILNEPFALDAFTRENLWQTMHRMKESKPVTGVLITHDLRKAIFLADRVVVLSGRPARSQRPLDVPQTGPRGLDHLNTPEAAERLAVLRHQIENTVPKTLPEFIGALKVALTLAFIATNPMEIASPQGGGLGALFASGKTNSNDPLMFAVLIALAGFGIVLSDIMVGPEKMSAGWAERGNQ